MWQTGSACYSSQALANGAAASAQSGAVVSVGGDLAVISVGTVTDTSIQYVLTSVTTGAVAGRTVSVTPPVCGLLDHSDAVAYGGAVVLCFAVAWGFKALARFILDMTSGGSSYGNS